MTIRIVQKSGNDCVLAALAMAAGKKSWEEAWTEVDLQEVIKSKGVGDIDPWMQRLGYEHRKDYITVYVHGDSMEMVQRFLWKRRALLSVHSLNIKGGNHMVYWDGDIIHDPSPERTYLHIESCIINRAIIFTP